MKRNRIVLCLLLGLSSLETILEIIIALEDLGIYQLIQIARFLKDITLEWWRRNIKKIGPRSAQFIKNDVVCQLA